MRPNPIGLSTVQLVKVEDGNLHVENVDILDGVEQVTNDQAFSMARRLSDEEGIPGGISSGAAVAVALQVAARPEMQGKRIVVIIPSCAERYMSTDLFKGIEV